MPGTGVLGEWTEAQSAESRPVHDGEPGELGRVIRVCSGNASRTQGAHSGTYAGRSQTLGRKIVDIIGPIWARAASLLLVGRLNSREGR